MTIEARSWTYDNLQTYLAMCPPGTKIKTTQLIDGELREVELGKRERQTQAGHRGWDGDARV